MLVGGQAAAVSICCPSRTPSFCRPRWDFLSNVPFPPLLFDFRSLNARVRSRLFPHRQGPRTGQKIHSIEKPSCTLPVLSLFEAVRNS